MRNKRQDQARKELLQKSIIHSLKNQDKMMQPKPIRAREINRYVLQIPLILFARQENMHIIFHILLCDYRNDMLEDSGSAENKEILLFSHDKLSLASILRPLHQVTKEMLV